MGNTLRMPRLIKVAAKIAANPSASFPQQMETWGDLKAAYRLFAAKGVTFEAVATPHWQQTRARPPGRYLVLGDTTELDFGIRRKDSLPDLAPTGNGLGYGVLLHSGLMIDADSEQLVGLTGQVLHYRQPAPQNENTTQRLKRERESEIWGQVIDQTGPPLPGVQFIHVLDRGADNFEVYCHCRQQGSDWVVRVNQLQRKILTPTGEAAHLADYLETLPLAGTYQLKRKERLEPMIGLMSIEAVRLVQMKTLAQTDPERPAAAVVPHEYIEMLASARQLRSRDMTIYQFYREMAKLGGFLGRRGDGEPGWITIWRGWEKLHTLVEGARFSRKANCCYEKPG